MAALLALGATDAVAAAFLTEPRRHRKKQDNSTAFHKGNAGVKKVKWGAKDIECIVSSTLKNVLQRQMLPEAYALLNKRFFRCPNIPGRQDGRAWCHCWRVDFCGSMGSAASASAHTRVEADLRRKSVA